MTTYPHIKDCIPENRTEIFEKIYGRDISMYTLRLGYEIVKKQSVKPWLPGRMPQYHRAFVPHEKLRMVMSFLLPSVIFFGVLLSCLFLGLTFWAMAPAFVASALLFDKMSTDIEYDINRAQKVWDSSDEGFVYGHLTAIARYFGIEYHQVSYDLLIHMAEALIRRAVAVVEYREKHPEIAAEYFARLNRLTGAPMPKEYRSRNTNRRDDDSHQDDVDFSPKVNIDGSPMVGNVDIHGNVYGVTHHASAGGGFGGGFGNPFD